MYQRMTSASLLNLFTRSGTFAPMEKPLELSKSIKEFCAPADTVIPIGVTLGEAIQGLRKKKIEKKLTYYFYVIDQEGRLKGVLSTRSMLLSDSDVPIEKIMQDRVERLQDNETIKEALELFNKHPFLAIPVVDKENKLVGILEIQSIIKQPIDRFDTQALFDLFQMVGFRLEESTLIPLHRSFRLRMPWLLCNVASGILCAIISSCYETVLSKAILLAFFIPLVLTLSEAASMQAMTQSLQFLRRPRFHWITAIKRGLQEWQVVGALAVFLGLGVGFLSLLWRGGWRASLTIGAGITFSTTLSALFAISLPVVLHRLKLDPKIASGPVVLMISDILTTAIYLSFGFWWIL